MIRSQGKHETVPSLYLILSFLPVRDILILWWWSTCFGINATLTREEGRGKVIMVHCPNGVLRIPFVGRSQAPTRGEGDLSSGVYCIEAQDRSVPTVGH